MNSGYHISYFMGRVYRELTVNLFFYSTVCMVVIYKVLICKDYLCSFKKHMDDGVL